MARFYTSESVTAGHPDKLCDAISDAIVDACLTINPRARVAVETLVKSQDVDGTLVGFICLAGEVTFDKGEQPPDYEHIARTTAAAIGYSDSIVGMNAMDPAECQVKIAINNQSPDIALGVDTDGAGDQGIMFGFACDETEAFEELQGRFFPLSAALAQRITRRLTIVREEGLLEWVRPDGKSQVTLEYDEGGTVRRIDTVVVAIQHAHDLLTRFDGSIENEQKFVRSQIIEHVIHHAVPEGLIDEKTRILVNGTGRFADPGGPATDAGLTGRKIIVDTYGGVGRHGGGAFSGKDPTKVDRSAAYASRWAAKHIVAAGLATKVEIQLGYCIGVAEPVSFNIDTFGTAIIDESSIESIVNDVFDFRPKSIIEALHLTEPVYGPTSSGGHFGRVPYNGFFRW